MDPSIFRAKRAKCFGGKIWPKLGDCPSDFRIIQAGDSINLRGVHSEGQKV